MFKCNFDSKVVKEGRSKKVPVHRSKGDGQDANKQRDSESERGGGKGCLFLLYLEDYEIAATVSSSYGNRVESTRCAPGPGARNAGEIT